MTLLSYIGPDGDQVRSGGMARNFLHSCWLPGRSMYCELTLGPSSPTIVSLVVVGWDEVDGGMMGVGVLGGCAGVCVTARRAG